MEVLTLEDAMKYPNARLIDDIKKNYYQDLEDFIKGKYYAVWVKTDTSIKISNCKLVLRPFESLTDEEKKTIEDIFGRAGMFFILTKNGYGMHDKQVEVINYLRSINIDIDGFIESGKAIEKK